MPNFLVCELPPGSREHVLLDVGRPAKDRPPTTTRSNHPAHLLRLLEELAWAIGCHLAYQVPRDVAVGVPKKLAILVLGVSPSFSSFCSDCSRRRGFLAGLALSAVWAACAQRV